MGLPECGARTQPLARRQNKLHAAISLGFVFIYGGLKPSPSLLVQCIYMVLDLAASLLEMESHTTALPPPALEAADAPGRT